ncbi:MAG: ribosomal protein S18-alanine N-acetyltransferase [Planctomycetota bacterium]|nr:ribosomal protein S18-alanine N-acetyltransferase [Planctomycetota bacterium]
MSLEPTEHQGLHIRWMIRRDMADVLKIENANFEFPWSEDDFIRCLRQRNCIGMVAERDDKIVGFMIYELHKNRLHVLNFSVGPDHQRSKVGTTMVEKLKSKLSTQRRNRVVLEVRETNLDAQLFFREQGFMALSVLRDYYEDTVEDAYLMQFRHTADHAEKSKSRISRLAG